jgi:hypothetical protein
MPRSWSAARPRLDRVRSLVVVVALVLICACVWRWQIQTVDVVIVNASGTQAQFSWQPRPFAEFVTVDMPGCASKSMNLLAGEAWQLQSRNLDIDSTAVDVPLFRPAVAVEIWLNGDGSHRFVPAYPNDTPKGAPAGIGCSSGNG